MYSNDLSMLTSPLRLVRINSAITEMVNHLLPDCRLVVPRARAQGLVVGGSLEHSHLGWDKMAAADIAVVVDRAAASMQVVADTLAPVGDMLALAHTAVEAAAAVARHIVPLPVRFAVAAGMMPRFAL